ncbi:MAG: hypothetical protein PHG61_06890 [Candidatus Marinimicrobia bacterium]|nr:hypothetical protein [Candidatus Neomarinimicrobiota bacterium]
MTKKTIAVSVEAVVDDTESFVALGPTFRSGGVVCYDRIAVADRDNVPTLITIGFVAGTREYDVDSFIPTVAGQVVSVHSRIFVPASYRVFARIYGGTSGDKFALTIYGYIDENANS